MTAIDIKDTSEARALAEAQGVLQRLHDRHGETEQALAEAKERQKNLTDQLADAEVSEDEKEAARIRRELAALDQRIEQLEIQELGLRKAANQQHSVVSRLREPIERRRIERAVAEWLDLLPRLEAWIANSAPAVGPISAQMHFGARLIDAATGRRLSWHPDASDVGSWRASTAEFIQQLRKTGFTIPDPEA